MGEFKVHRVRFFGYMPSGIRCMSFNERAERLALGRLDGTLEIFNFKDSFYQEKVIPGNDSRSVEAVCWVAERLFTAGLNGEITEYDLENLCPKYSLDAFGGPIWTVACNAQGTHLAVGCEDGSIKLFEILPEKIRFERNLDRQKGRVLSLSWHESGTRIAAGMLDMIRIFDVQSGELCTCLMLVDRGVSGMRNHECVVWCVAFLSDLTVISTDSSGKVQVWNAAMGILSSTHLVSKSDVLSLAVSKDESSFVVGTSEGTVVQFQFLANILGGDEKAWVRTKTFKPHTHDVRALAEIGTAVVSGGLDTQLVVRPLLDKVDIMSYDNVLHKIHFPHRSLVSCAQKAGMLLFQFPAQLEVWRLGESEGRKPGDTLFVKKNPEKLLQLKRKGEDHISCSAISPCGGWLAYSTVSSLRVYRLQCDEHVSISKVGGLCHCSSTRAPRTALLHFDSLSLLSAWCCSFANVFKSHPVCLCLLFPGAQCISHHILLLSSPFPFQPHCTVPIYGSCPTAMGIHPTSNNLLMVHADRQIFEYSIVEKQYTDWSRRVQREGLHKLWLERDTPVTHVTFNPRNAAQFMLHDTYMFCIIDQSLPLPDNKCQFYNQITLKSLSEQERLSHAHAFKMCTKYQHLLFLGLLDDESLVVVQRPLTDIASQLPAPVRLKKFAT
uniref:UTP4 small subunit processome component n=1 Tax=Scleropages formosus TaxID=113540 RepID=A0A8C9VF86_SCLFO